MESGLISQCNVHIIMDGIILPLLHISFHRRRCKREDNKYDEWGNVEIITIDLSFSKECTRLLQHKLCLGIVHTNFAITNASDDMDGTIEYSLESTHKYILKQNK